MLTFVSGNKFKSALIYGNKLIKENRQPIINYINEDGDDKNKYLQFVEYNNILNFLNKDYIIALKLSSINFDTILLNKIVNKCNNNNVKLIIDAEDNNNIKKFRDITNRLILNYNKNNSIIIKTYQMYRKDSLDELNKDFDFFKQNNCNLIPKLVRGAYWHSEKNYGHLYTNKQDTDNNYNTAINICYENNNKYNILATHNKKSINLGLKFNDLYLSKNENINQKPLFQIANLMGMNNNYQNYIKNKYTNNKFITATYIPYGPYQKMFPYLIRRLYENIDSIKYTIL